MKKLLASVLVLCMMAALLAGCGSKPAPAPAATEAPKAEEPAPAPAEEPKAEETAPAEEPAEAEEEEDEENYETGDASLDDPLNQDEIGEKELLVVSFGTSFNDSRRLTIGAIEKAIQEAYPDWSVRRAFTSQIIIDHVAKRDGEVIDNVTEALDRAVANNVKVLFVQPTHLMDGYEYNELKDELAKYADAFEQIIIGKPLLQRDADFGDLCNALADATDSYVDGETAIVLMGHGTEADSNWVYEHMQKMFDEAGAEDYFVGTVEATPSLEDVLAKVQAGNYKRVVLRPMMIVAGDHANNDMAGPDEDSWKSVFEGAGYEVECVLEGLGQLPEVRRIILDHVFESMTQQVTTK